MLGLSSDCSGIGSTDFQLKHVKLTVSNRRAGAAGEGEPYDEDEYEEYWSGEEQHEDYRNFANPSDLKHGLEP